MPEPVRTSQVHDPDKIADLRRLDCRQYNLCLTVAAEHDWDSFHCNSCKAHDPLTEIERRADLEGIALLIAEIPAVYRPHPGDGA